MIFVTSPFYWYHAMTMTLTYFKVKFVAGWGTTILQNNHCIGCVCTVNLTLEI